MKVNAQLCVCVCCFKLTVSYIMPGRQELSFKFFDLVAAFILHLHQLEMGPIPTQHKNPGTCEGHKNIQIAVVLNRKKLTA